MRPGHSFGTFVLGVSFACAGSPAVAQSALDPATSTVCGLVNFAFCPQGVPPAPLPDPERDAERATRPAPMPDAPVHRRQRRVMPRSTDGR